MPRASKKEVAAEGAAPAATEKPARASRSKTSKENSSPKKSASKSPSPKKRAASKSPKKASAEKKKKSTEKSSEKASPKKRTASKSPKKSTEKASPKKKAAPKKKTAASSARKGAGAGGLRKTKPTYQVMAAQVLSEHANSRKVLSSLAILKFLKEKYELPETAALSLRRALKEGQDEGYFANGVNKLRSYYVTPKGKSKLLGDKKPRARKAAAKKEGAASPKKRAAPKKRTTANSTKEGAAAPAKRAPKKAAPKRASKSTEASSEESEAPSVAVGGSKYDHFWQYKENEAHWGNYTVEASDILEGVYQGYLANRGDTDVRSVKSGQWEYQVDFMAMKQTNLQHPSHTVRDIRRVPNNK